MYIALMYIMFDINLLSFNNNLKNHLLSLIRAFTGEGNHAVGADRHCRVIIRLIFTAGREPRYQLVLHVGPQLEL